MTTAKVGVFGKILIAALLALGLWIGLMTVKPATSEATGTYSWKCTYTAPGKDVRVYGATATYPGKTNGSYAAAYNRMNYISYMRASNGYCWNSVTGAVIR